MFSKSCQYAIKIMTFIAFHQQNENDLVGLDSISKAINSPKAFTAKILQQLTKSKLLHSTRGRSGGFYISEKADVSLADIVIAVDGNNLLDGCLLGFGECSEKKPCVVHHELQQVRLHFKKQLLQTDLTIITDNINHKNGFFKE